MIRLSRKNIKNIRRKISYTSVIMLCQNSNTPQTKHQKSVNAKLMKWYCKAKHLTLTKKLAEFKHEQKIPSDFLKNKKLLAQ